MKHFSSKKIITGGIILIIAFLCLSCNKDNANNSSATVNEEIIKNQIQISGYIEAAQQQSLQSPGEGIVKSVNVKEGQTVKKGQLIFSLDSSSQSVKVAKQEFAIAQEKINGSSRRLQLMKKELLLLRKQLKDRSVYAKFDGIVAMLDVTEGEYAKPQDTFGMIIDRSFLKSKVSVSEMDASKLKVGQIVLLKFMALPELEVKGSIIAYPSIAKLNTQVGNTVVEAKLRVDNPNASILPGYSFNGQIIVGEDEKVLLVEQSAIFYEEGQPYVEKMLENKKTEKIKVQIEPYFQGFVKIISDKIADKDILKTNIPIGGQF